MGLLARIEQRSVSSSIHPRDPALIGMFGFPNSAAGIYVTPDSAMRHAAVYRAVRLLATTMATLPLVVYERMAKGGQRRADDHPLAQVLHRRPNQWQTPFEWKEMMAGHFELRGNAYSEIMSDGRGRVRSVIPLHPDRVTPRSGVLAPDVGETIWYEYQPITGPKRIILWDDMLHFRDYSVDGLTGISRIELARNTLGLAMANQEYASRFFSNGAMPGGVLAHPKTLSEPAKASLRESWNRMHGGGPKNAHKVAILEEGLTWTAVGVSNKDSQFIENRKFDTEEIARLFDIPPHMLMDLDRSTNNNIEQQSIEFVMSAILPRATRWEEAIERDLMLPSDEGRFYPEFLLEGMLRGDSAARGVFYNTMFNLGAYSPNDIRRKENENPVEGGDEYFVPLNMVPLRQAAQLLEDQTKINLGGGAPVAGTDPKAPTLADPAKARALALRTRIVGAHVRLFVDAINRSMRKEVQAARRALDKATTARSISPFDAWIDEYYPEHEGFVARALEPIVHTTGEAIAIAASAEVGLVIPEDGLPGLDELLRNQSGLAARALVIASRTELRRILREVPPEQRAETITAALTDWELRRAVRDGAKEAGEVAALVAAFVYRAAGVTPIDTPLTPRNDP